MVVVALDHIQGHANTHTHTHTHTHCETSLDEGSVRRRDRYVTTQNKTERHSCQMVGFEPTIPATERPKTNALYRAVTEIGP